MSVERRNFGKLPISRGAFIQGTTYYKYNIVVNNGSSFMAATDGVTAEPIATYNASTKTFTVTAGWILMSYGSDVVSNQEAIPGKASIEDLENGTITVKYSEEAADLTGESTDRIYSADRFLIRTTAGDLDVRSDMPARIHTIRAIMDQECHPLTLTGFRWNGFNLLDPAQVINSASITNNTIVAGSNKVYIFRVPRCEWGAYGESTKNNGILFTDNTKAKYTPANVGVFEGIGLPAIGSALSAVSIQSHNGYNYYLPAEGYLCVEIPSSVSAANICAHLAWSNAWDDDFEVRSATLVNVASIVNSIHSWGMAGITVGGRSAFDEIVFDEEVTSNRKWYRRVNRAQLKDLTWTVTSEANTDGTTTYKFTATISALKLNGIIQSPFEGLTVNENTINFASTAIATVEDLITAVGENYVYYELATEVSGSHSVSGSGICNDLGTEELVGAYYPSAAINLSYVQGLKDYLRGLPASLESNFRILTEAVAMLFGEIQTLKTPNSDLGDVRARDLTIDVIPSICNSKLIIVLAGEPSVTPDFEGQFYVDTANDIAYIATGVSSASDWDRITNA